MKENSNPIGENSTINTREILDPTILNFALQNGIINVDAVRQCYEMNERKKFLEMHPYSIWEGKDGKWRTYLPDDIEGRKLKKKTTQSGIEQLVIDYWKSKEQKITIESVFNEWNDRRLECQKISDATHLRNKQVFNRHYETIKDKDISYCTAEWLEDFLESEISRLGLKAKAFANLKSVTRGMLKRAKKRNLISYSIEEVLGDLDVSDREFQSSVKDDSEQVFDEEDLPKMIDYLTSNTGILELAILTMLVTGLRVGEVVALKPYDYDPNMNCFYVQRTETRFKNDLGHYQYAVKERPKTEASIRKTMVPSAYHWLYEAICKENPLGQYLFMLDGLRVNAQQVRRRMYRICDLLGIKRKSPHKARKTYGTILLDNGVDDKFIEMQMGHTSILTTKNHYYKNRKTVSTRQNILDSIPDFKYA